MTQDGHSTRDRIIDALMDLAAEQDWDGVPVGGTPRGDQRLLVLHHVHPDRGEPLRSVLVGHARAGRVKWRCASVFAVSGMIGAALGAELGKAFDGKRLLVLFGLLMIGLLSGL